MAEQFEARHVALKQLLGRSGALPFVRKEVRHEDPRRRHGAVTSAERQDVASLVATFFSMQDLKQPVSAQSDVDFAGRPDSDSDISDLDSDISDLDSDGGLSSDDAETIMGDLQRRRRRADADIDEVSVLALAAAAEKLEAPRPDVAGARINRRARPKRAEDYTADEATRFFRFSPENLRTLITELRIPPKLRWESTTVGHWTQFDGEVCFLILLRRMANVTRCVDLETEFNMSGPEISRAQACMTQWLDENYSHLVSEQVAPPSTWPQGQPSGLNRWRSELIVWAVAVAVAIALAGAPELDQYFGFVCMFVDGFFADMARPSGGAFLDLQRAFYTRFQAGHGILFQCVVAPNGLFVDVFGPTPGRHNDINNQYKSRISERLMRLFGRNGRQFTCFGDGIYQRSPAISRAAQGVNPSPALRQQSRALNRCRTSVEHAFGKLTSLWKFLRMHDKHRLLDSPVGMQRTFRVAFLLTNLHTCMYGSQVALNYTCARPSVGVYLRGGVRGRE
jgi:hypothetical protein